jgi:multidrug efflux pump subunit AcrA (membrane-fusion protein)
MTGGRHPRLKREAAHTVYVLREGATKPEPVQVHLGISDDIYTEVLDGLQDGDVVVDSILVPNPSPVSGQRRPF